jgi:hypothetical protein
MPALFAADRAFARPEFLEDSGPFLLPVWSAIGPHVPAVRARQPPWNCGVKVFHVIVVASRAFWLRRLLDPQRDDPRFLLCDLIFHDAVTNILAFGPFVHNRRTRAARDARPVPGVPGGPSPRCLSRNYRRLGSKCMTAQAFAAWSLHSSTAEVESRISRPSGTASQLSSRAPSY